VKLLENEGIGRPSTYASIIGTITDEKKGYAQLSGNTLYPTFMAFAVTGLLEQNFPDLVDTGFTAKMEQTLDDISTGEVDWLPYLKTFYLGDAGLATQVEAQKNQIDPAIAKTISLEDLQAKVKISKYGAYLELDQNGEIVKANIPDSLTPADLDSGRVELLLKQKIEGPEKLGMHPESGEPIFVLTGKYGPYVQLGETVPGSDDKPKRSSLPKGITETNITLEQAVGLLTLPRNLGTHPEDDCKIQASLGRFGPYIVHDKGKEGKEYRSLKGDDNPVTITLERALALLAEPKPGRRGAAGKAKEPLRALGNHPEDNEPVGIYDGPYGPYIKHGKVNASLPEGGTVESMTLELALPLLAAKAGTKSTRTKTSSAKKASTTKTSAKKSTTAKASTSKTSAAKASTTKATTAKTTTAKTKTTSSKTAASKTTKAKSTASTAKTSTAKTSQTTPTPDADTDG
jgi:DNA topoisomerase I